MAKETRALWNGLLLAQRHLRVSPVMASLAQFVFNLADTLINVETALWIFVYKK